MRKKAVLFIILFIVIILIFFKNIKINNLNESSKKINSDHVNRINQNMLQQSYGTKVDDNTYDITNILSNKNSGIKYIHNLNKDKMYVATEEAEKDNLHKKIVIRLYNMINGKIEKQIDFEKKSQQYNFISLNNGFYVIEKTNESADKKVFYHIYDSGLNLIQTIDVSSIENKIHYLPVLSNGAHKLAYIEKENNYDCIYMCDLYLNNKQKICQIKTFQTNKLSNFENIVFMEGDKKIAFVGSIFIKEDIQPKAFGTVDIETGELIYKEHDGINYIEVINGKTLFSDASMARDKDSSGKVFILNNITGSMDEYNLQDKNESQAANISDKGNYIITFLNGKLLNNEPIYKVRIYNVNSKKCINEFNTTFKGKDYIKCGIRNLSISEDNNCFYMSYKIDEEIRLYKYILN